MRAYYSLSRYSGVGGEGILLPAPGTGLGVRAVLLPSPGTPGEGLGVRAIFLPFNTGSNMASPSTLYPERGATCPHPQPLSRSTGRGEQDALNPGVPGEGSNMPSPPTPLPEYRESGARRPQPRSTWERGATCPHPQPLSRSTGREGAICPHAQPLSRSTGRAEQDYPLPKGRGWNDRRTEWCWQRSG